MIRLNLSTSRCARCCRPVQAKGLCLRHYQQDWLRAKPRCSLCDRPFYKAGLCQTHYARKRAGKPVSAAIRPYGQGHINTDGYVFVAAADHPNVQTNGYMAEHRLHASRQLGRPLERSELVHHRNGIKTDNTAGPCLLRSFCDCADGPHNLELCVTKQPPGQRVGDLLVWAKELLRTYEPSALASEDNGCHRLGMGTS